MKCGCFLCKGFDLKSGDYREAATCLHPSVVATGDLVSRPTFTLLHIMFLYAIPYA